MKDNCNQLAKPIRQDILDKLNAIVQFDSTYEPFGDGESAEKIVESIREFFAQ